MSLSDPKVQQENSDDWVKAQKAKAHKIVVEKWLRDNPRIGVLNGPYHKYYFWDYKADKQAYIRELEVIDWDINSLR